MSLKIEPSEQPMFEMEDSSSLHNDQDLDILDEFLDKRLYDETPQQQRNHQLPDQPASDTIGLYRDDELFTNFLTDEINKNEFLIFNQDAANTDVLDAMTADTSVSSSFNMGHVDQDTPFKAVDATTPVSIDTNTSPKQEIFHTPTSIDNSDSASYENARSILSQLRFGSETTAQFNNDFPKSYLEVDEATLPYRLQVSSLPSHSRVETQIKLDLSVSPPPPQFLVHLPGDTIAKQKFCLSSPLSEEVRSSVLFLETFVLTASTLKPCNICVRCIRREQKRASRRKAGVADNRSWSLDSVKRAIIFNCKEIISFPPTSAATTNSKSIDVSARIVCYCRHHQEQKGFKLLFVLKNSQDEILAKHLSTPIMIMDRKKNSDDQNSVANSVPNSDFNSAIKPLSPTSYEEDSSEPHTSDSRTFKRKRIWSPELSDGFSITPQRKPSSNAIQSMYPSANLQFSRHNSSTSVASQGRAASISMNSTAPMIQRIIPAQGPLRGGIEVTLLGSNFKQGLNVKFGMNRALSTQCWSDSTIVTYLPPASQPGQVVVTIEDPEQEDSQEFANKHGTSIFTYLDDTERQMIELALQIVGLKMNGKLEDARNIARKIIGNDGNKNTGNASEGSSAQSVSSSTFNKLAASTDEDLVLQVIHLLPNNPNLSICTPEGQNLLHLSCLKGYYRLVSSLLQKGARVDSRDVNGFTPLHYASLKGDRKSIELLLNCKACPFVKADNGVSPEDVADSNVLDIFKALDPSNDGSGMTRKYSDSSISSIFSVDDHLEWPAGKHVSRLTNDRFTSGDETDYDSEEEYDNMEASDEESDNDYNYERPETLPTEQIDSVNATTVSSLPSNTEAPSEKSLWKKVKNVFNQEDLPRYDDLFPSKSLTLTQVSSSSSITEISTEDSEQEVHQDPEFIFQKFFNQRKNFQNDKMLLFFWLPLLILILSSFVLINVGWKLEFNDHLKEFIRQTVGNIMLGNERFKIYLNRHLSQVNEAVTSVINVA